MSTPPKPLGFFIQMPPNGCSGSCDLLSPRVKDVTGERFGRLVVLSHQGRNTSAKSRNHCWLCQCDCGAKRVVSGSALRIGETRSCGCLQREIAKRAGDRTRTHGKTKTSTYSIWDSMRQRCENPSRKDFKRYGGRGIKVCDRWSSFDAFYADMGERPAGMSIDRRENDKGYSPENCYWATSIQQARNHSANRVLTVGGESRCVSEWAESIGMKPVTLHARLGRGWSAERAIATPLLRKARHE